MSSKSSSSIVKSVESTIKSVVPKNMNMKHILLAVLVGLLLCMMMSNTVEGVSNVQGQDISTSNAGYCGVSLLGKNDTSCVPDKFSSSSTDPADSSVVDFNSDNNNQNDLNKSKLINICSDLGAGDPTSCSHARTDGDLGGEIANRIRLYNTTEYPSQTAADKAPIGGSADQPGDGSDVYLSCKTVVNNTCGTLSSQSTCNADDDCEWNDCSAFVNNTDFPFYGPSEEGGNPFPTASKNFKQWKKCVLSNNIAGGSNPTGTPVISSLGEVSWPLSPVADTNQPWINAYSISGDGSPGPLVSGQTTSGDTVGLTEWFKGKPGILRRSPTSAEWTAADLQAANAIPMNNDGTVPSGLASYLPDNMKTGLENMWRWCGTGLTADDSNKIAIGFDEQLQTFKCLNNNPNIATNTSQRLKPRYDCINTESQSCFKNSDNTQCGENPDECWTLSEPTIENIQTAGNLADQATAAIKVLGSTPTTLMGNVRSGLATLSKTV